MLQPPTTFTANFRCNTKQTASHFLVSLKGKPDKHLYTDNMLLKYLRAEQPTCADPNEVGTAGSFLSISFPRG